MNNKKSDTWDEKEKDDTQGFRSDGTSYVGTYPYLPKKVTVVIGAVAILFMVGVVDNMIDPPPSYMPTVEQIDAMSCLELQEFIEKNVDNNRPGMDSWTEVVTLKFLDECSSYGK